MLTLDLQEAREFAQGQGVGFFEASARSGENIEEVFDEMARSLIRNEEEVVRQMSGQEGAVLPAGMRWENSQILNIQQQNQAAIQAGGGYCCYIM